MNTLAQAMDAFYEAFADLARPRRIATCSCCLDKNQAAPLLSTPLRQITSNDLAPYASSALLTVGSVSDYLYFLPRILELSILDGRWGPGVEVIAKAIHSTNPQSWPARRREALRQLLEQVIDALVEMDGDLTLDGWICAIAIIGFDVAPFLASIEKHPAAVLLYFEENVHGLKEGKLNNPFWKLPDAGHDLIVQWFKSDAVRKIAFEAYGYQM
ncbi:hypothetical protein BH10PLA2_BH10PLA2_29330 [soil metagenome]